MKYFKSLSAEKEISKQKKNQKDDAAAAYEKALKFLMFKELLNSDKENKK